MADSRPGEPLQDSEAIAISGKVMVAAIIVLFMVVVFILFLHLYAKWFWGTNDPRRSRRRFVFTGEQDPIRVQRQGLDQSMIQSLPVIVFQSEKFKDGLDCAVCLCEFEENEKARLLPKCNHSFHIDCIDMWFQSHSTCPMCRTSVRPDPLDQPNPNGSEIVVIADGNPDSNSDSNSNQEVHDSSSNFPTNVLIWGTHDRVSTGLGSSGVEEGASSSKQGLNGAIVINIPRRVESFASSVAEEEVGVSSPNGGVFNGLSLKSPTTPRLRSFKRLLSRDKRVVPCSPRGSDIEKGGEINQN